MEAYVHPYGEYIKQYIYIHGICINTYIYICIYIYTTPVSLFLSLSLYVFIYTYIVYFYVFFYFLESVRRAAQAGRRSVTRSDLQISRHHHCKPSQITAFSQNPQAFTHTSGSREGYFIFLAHMNAGALECEAPDNPC